ncbi:MAG: hypothetical protein GQ534_01450, partial [Candidatus Delongbacteria bacterium]|nr:hypothetical protein [Candidatus Delongbacteria bacterium]
MKKMIFLLLLVNILLSAQTPDEIEIREQRSKYLYDLQQKQDFSIENRVHRVGLFWLNITNMGTFGNSMYLNDPCTGKLAVFGDMPGGEEVRFLYEGSLWFGGYLDSAIVNVNGTNATVFQGPLVSTGNALWTSWYSSNELSPILFDEDPSGAILGRITETSNVEGRINCLFEDVYDPAASAQEQFETMYTDKYIGNAYDIFDKRSHIPLGIEVKQKSYSWSYKFAEKFIIIDYTLYNRNEEQKDIYDFFMGVQVDNDIGRLDGLSYYADDLCGFIQQWDGYIDPATGENKPVDLNFAWAADNDGREQTRQYLGGPIMDPRRGKPLDGATGVATLRVLRNPNPNLKYSFNIVVPGYGLEQYDWGPRWQPGFHSDWEFDLSKRQKGYDDTNYDSLYTTRDLYLAHGRTEGTPIGDIGRYMVMSNFEYDYGILDMREVYLRVFEDPPNLIGTPFAQADKWQPWLMAGEFPDGTKKDLNYMTNGTSMQYVLSFGPLGDESYVNVAVDLDLDSLGTLDDFINKQVWKFTYGDSLKLTLAFIVSEDFHTSVRQFAGYWSPYVIDLDQGIDESLFENGWYDAYYNVVWAERVYDQPM